MTFTLIPAGTFQMGSDEPQAVSDEKPLHSVRISNAFYLGTTEVTQQQWKAIMGADTNRSNFKGDDLPVETVSWNEVQEFIRKLNAKEGGEKYRLPTEAEWEYAARAGTTTAYSFGDEENQLGEYAWYDGNSGGKTHPVGRLKANDWGLHDMYGNVWEWAQDWYSDYTAATTEAPAVDPKGSAEGAYRWSRNCCGYRMNSGLAATACVHTVPFEFMSRSRVRSTRRIFAIASCNMRSVTCSIRSSSGV
jgi:formylglycine-generating enzyme required for sulfatase activity